MKRTYQIIISFKASLKNEIKQKHRNRSINKMNTFSKFFGLTKRDTSFNSPSSKVAIACLFS